MLTIRRCALMATSALAAIATMTSLVPTASANTSSGNPFVGSYDGWTFIQDAPKDSTGGRKKYEIFGLATKQVNDTLWFAINANTPLKGADESRATDRNVGFGDLMLNFGGIKHGVRFAEVNDSGVDEVGVYSDITTKDITADNAGWARQTRYKRNQKDARFYGDSRDDAFFSDNSFRNAEVVLASGTKVGDVNFLGKDDLLNFKDAFDGDKIGKNTFGFSFNLTPNMIGEFDAKLLLECINDGVALTGHVTDVPEPAAMVGLLAVGAGIVLNRRKKAQQA